MKKNKQGLFVEYISRPWFMAVFAVFVFSLLHAILFVFHAFMLFRHESLYEQICTSGATIQMPEDFLRVQKRAQNRSFFSRPDVLVAEIGTLQSATRFMIHQYKNDIYRLHDAIVQHIKYFTVATEIGEELLYPGQEMLIVYADIFQKRLDTIPLGDINGLLLLFELSDELVAQVQSNINYAQRKLIFQDILAFKHEMLLLADMYRLNTPKDKLDTKKFWAEFRKLFSRESLKTSSIEDLQQSLQSLRDMAKSYRETASEILTKNRERRVSWVDTESKKWQKLETMIPLSPLPDAYQLIYISLAKQMMYIYEDNELILSTSITSGRQNFETIRGIFHVYTKQRGKLMKSPFPDEVYELWVDYWLGFSGAYGIHDACNSKDCWRTKFGGGNYIYNGSHGCLNTPYNAVKFIYNWAKVGTTVYVK